MCWGSDYCFSLCVLGQSLLVWNCVCFDSGYWFGVVCVGVVIIDLLLCMLGQ